MKRRRRCCVCRELSYDTLRTVDYRKRICLKCDGQFERVNKFGAVRSGLAAMKELEEREKE